MCWFLNQTFYISIRKTYICLCMHCRWTSSYQEGVGTYICLSVICYSFLWSLLPDKFSNNVQWPPIRDTRNYQLLVICHARSNVTSLNLSLRKRSKHNNKITKLCWNCEITDKKIISIKKKGQNTTKKSQSCVKIMKLPIKKLLVFFFRSTRIIRYVQKQRIGK